MSDNISVHDNVLVSYSVRAEEKRIVLHTEFRDREPHEFTDVIFEDVLAYDFQNDLFGTIIFDIREVDLSKLIEERSELFEDGWRYGWPRGWDPRKESMLDYARRLNARAFELSASYGMHGWILAGGMTKLVRREKAGRREVKATLEDFEDRRELVAAKKRNGGKGGTPLLDAARELGL
jgi:hypothetical protein